MLPNHIIYARGTPEESGTGGDATLKTYSTLPNQRSQIAIVPPPHVAGPHLVESGRCWVKLHRKWSTRAGFGRNRAKSGRVRANFGRQFLSMPRQVWAALADDRPNLTYPGQFGSMLTDFGPQWDELVPNPISFVPSLIDPGPSWLPHRQNFADSEISTILADLVPKLGPRSTAFGRSSAKFGRCRAELPRFGEKNGMRSETARGPHACGPPCI